MDCPVCGKIMYDNRENKKNPKAPDYRCKDKSCKWELDKETKQWVASEYGTAIWVKKSSPTPNLAPSASGSIFQGSKTSSTDTTPKVQETPPVAPKTPIIKDTNDNIMTKADWADKDASIASLALCKVKAIARGYEGLDGVVAEDINERIYEDYIFFLNRIRKEA